MRVLFTLFLMALATLTATAQITPTVGFATDANTVALYRFDEGTGTSFADSSGNGLHGTISGATWTTGLFGSALSFDGVNDYGLVAHNAILNFASTDNFTQETWVKCRAGGTFFVKGERWIDYNYGLRDRGNGELRFRTTPGDPLLGDAPLCAVNEEKWMYIAAVHDGLAGEVRLYIDGKLHQTEAFTVNNGDINTRPMHFGAYSTTGGFSSFTIDETRISNVVRSAAEIEAHYQQNIEAAALNNYWSMDEGTGTMMGDSSRNPLIGTLHNGTQWSACGVRGNALLFDGVNDRVNVIPPPDYSGGDSLTVSAWVHHNPTGGNQNIISRYKASGNNRSWVFAIEDDEKLRFWFYDRPCAGGSSCSYFVETNQEVPANQWVHVAATYDGLSFVKLYINGQLDTTFTGTFEGLSIETCDYQLGDDIARATGSNPLEGMLDEVQLHSRVLSDAELQAHYLSLAPNVTIDVAIEQCDNLPTTFTAPAGSTYAWSTGETTGAIQYIAGVDTNISVQITDLSGCTYGAALAYEAPTHFPSYTVLLADSMCPGDSLFLAGSFQTQPGMYADSLQTVEGCDSILITTLSWLPGTHDTVAVSMCSNDSLLLGGSYQTQPGYYIDSLQAANGCDSVITTFLTLNPISFSTATLVICPGDSALLGGAYQLAAGVYSDTLQNQTGCDSIHYTALTVLPLQSNFATLIICSGDSVLINGNFESAAGLYTDTLQNQLGCDSISSVLLTLDPGVVVNVNQVICSGDSAFLGNSWQYNAGIYYDTLQMAATGCDSVIATALLVNGGTATALSISICQGDSLLLAGGYQTSSGLYSDTLSAANGCDSIVNTTLLVEPPITTAIAASMCAGDSMLLGGNQQTTAGIYYDTLQSANGCDSTTITTLHVLESETGLASIVICEGDSALLGGAYQYNSGIYEDVLVASNGCDSILSTVLEVIAPVHTSRLDTIAEGDSLFLAGAWQTQPGQYQDMLGAANGCDSVVTTTLMVLTGTGELPPAELVQKLYPNPTRGALHLSLAASTTETLLIARNVMGQEVLRTQFPACAGNCEYTINTGDLAAGIYMIELQAGPRSEWHRIVRSR